MSAYIKQLNASVEADAARRAEQGALACQEVRERLSPLEDRLRRLMGTIPEQLQRDGLSLSALQSSLRGRWRGNCHPGELGAALRKLGFARKRQWNGNSGFKALWYRNVY